MLMGIPSKICYRRRTASMGGHLPATAPQVMVRKCSRNAFLWQMPYKYGTHSNIAPHPLLVYHSPGEKGWDCGFFRS
jgi:hypothetical protein